MKILISVAGTLVKKKRKRLLAKEAEKENARIMKVRRINGTQRHDDCFID